MRLLVAGWRTCLASLLLWTGDAAYATATTDRLCGSSAPIDGLVSTDAQLEEASRRTEETLREERLANGNFERSIAALELTSTPGEGAAAWAPGAAALARYCTAAGEVMRLSIEGSQLQAQTYLQTALRQSRAARLASVSSQAAYRLGLVSLDGAAMVGLRGGAPRQRRSGTIIARQLRTAQAGESTEEICGALDALDAELSSEASTTLLALDCASRLALEAGDPALSALASLRFARFGYSWSDSSDDPEELVRVARDKALDALPVAFAIGDPTLRVDIVGRLVETSLDLGSSDGRLADAVAQLRAGGASDSFTAATVRGLEARLALARGDLREARHFAEQAILFESERALPVRLPGYFLLLAEADPAARAEHVLAAFSALENIRPLLPRTDPITEESTFALHMRRVFETAADVQLASVGANDEGEGIRRAQQIVEAFRQAELQSAVGSECLPSRTPLQPDDLGPDEILLYPLLLPDRVELIYLTGGDQSDRRFRRLPPNRAVGRRDITRLAESFVASLTGAQWQGPARQLYDILIRPIEDQLPPGSTLTIIPDGPLRAVPFAALLDREGRFLIDRTALAVAPALAYSQPGQADREARPSVLAAALQRQVTLPAGFFPALAGTIEEARVAANSGNPGRLIENFTRQQLVAELGRGEVDILHLATHAAFNGRSDRAFVVATDGAIRLSDLRAILADNLTRGDQLDLLVLSACETAVGDDEASMGLAGAAVQAGVLSTIASLWRVDDVGTTDLMEAFYTAYRSGRSRAGALRAAQLHLIESGGDNAHPYIWSAFTLLGAWR